MLVTTILYSQLGVRLSLRRHILIICIINRTGRQVNLDISHSPSISGQMDGLPRPQYIDYSRLSRSRYTVIRRKLIAFCMSARCQSCLFITYCFLFFSYFNLYFLASRDLHILRNLYYAQGSTRNPTLTRIKREKKIIE